MQQLTGEYGPAAAGYERALELFRLVGSEYDQADVLCELGMLQRQTGDYPAALTSQHQALDLFRRLGDQLGQAWALGELGLVHQLTRNYSAAATSLKQALQLHSDLGSRHGQAVALNGLSELSAQTAATEESRDFHDQALPEEARALTGIGTSLLPQRPAEAAVHLRHALAISQRIGSPSAQLIRDELDKYGL